MNTGGECRNDVAGAKLQMQPVLITLIVIACLGHMGVAHSSVPRRMTEATVK